MQNSNAVITDNEDDSTSTESDTETRTKNDVVESKLKKKNLAPFCVDEKVLAYHRLMIYEAKVLEVDPKTKRLLIHYLGWSKKWDEWVGIKRLMKHNEENLQKQKALEKDHPEMITKSGRLFLLKPKNFNVTNSKKRKYVPKDNASSGKLVNVQIPTPLITHLVNYCEYITHMGKLVKLPCSPNVDDILTLYLDHQSNKDDRASDSAGEILNGLRCYFDKALPAMLLYKCERQQYEEATANGISPSKIYGAEHLLRLFVKLPEILYYANIEEETMIELRHKLQDFLKFLKKKKNNLFLSTYETLGGASTIK